MFADSPLHLQQNCWAALAPAHAQLLCLVLSPKAKAETEAKEQTTLIFFGNV